MTGGKFNQDYGIGEIKVDLDDLKSGSRKGRKGEFARPAELLSEPLVLISAFNLCSQMTQKSIAESSDDN